MRRAATALLVAAALAVGLVAAIDALRGDGTGAETAPPATSGERTGGLPDELAVRDPIRLERPGGVAVVAGAVWVATGGALARIDPAEPAAPELLSLPGARPDGVVAAGGSLYVLDETARGAVRIDPAARLPAGRIAVAAAVLDVAFAAGDLWLPDPAGSAVLRVDPERGTVEARISVPGPTAVEAGAGAVWALSPGARLVSRIDPASNLVTPIALDAAPGGIAMAGGALWVSHPAAAAISRIDPERDVVAERLELGLEPLLIAGDGARLWALGIDRLVWVDARTGRVAGLARLRLTRPPGPEPVVLGGLAAGEGVAWVADTYGDALLGIDARP